MSKAWFAFSLAVLLLFIWLPQDASAKASTVKITISGGGLARSTNVTDPRILAFGSGWGGAFLDVSHSPL